MDDPGKVTLSRSDPRVGEAITATLTDDDGQISGQSWQWVRVICGWRGCDRSDIAGATSAGYTPVQADVGSYLEVTVTYTDAKGSGKRAQGEPRQAVKR